MSFSKLTDTQKVEIARLWPELLSVPQIAKATGIDRNVVRRYLDSSGIGARPWQPPEAGAGLGNNPTR